MKRDHIESLSSVAEAVFQREHQKLGPLLQHEAKILRQLSLLQAQSVEVKSENSLTKGYQITGADLVWHSWEESTRRDLNIELAKLRSQKLAAIDNLRDAFGRKQAVAELTHRLHKHRWR
ncbi:hypothetical protein [Ruegeria conchae]|uniref:Uncharacterized protein n=1 Tax=Ruegeria conchae TaxID=981384 RepID=A0A497Z319_9RHOB|nr:hypothetical protein [Ruegeria conchae]RLJ97996.1 hypothetical protein CLV75_4341 [Ruegeria conchae]